MTEDFLGDIPDQTRSQFHGMFKDLNQKEVENGIQIKPSKIWTLQQQLYFETVPVREKIESPEYMGLGEQKCVVCHGTGELDAGGRKIKCGECNGVGQLRSKIYQSHLTDIMSLWEARKSGGATTAVFQEGIGSGKTTKFCAILWLMLAEVLTKVNPLDYYGLSSKGQGIAFVCMSRNESLAKEVTFLTLLPFLDCPFFKTYFPPQVDLRMVQETKRFPSRLRFPKRVVVFPGTGSALYAIGNNLYGGGIDEANYLEVIDDSKKGTDSRKYDAAESMYAAIKARMKSRFDDHRLHREGKIPGLLVMFSNPRYDGDFTSRMEKLARFDRSIFFRKRCTWEAKPTNDFCGEKFLFNIMDGKIIEPDDPNYLAYLEAAAERENVRANLLSAPYNDCTTNGGQAESVQKPKKRSKK